MARRSGVTVARRLTACAWAGLAEHPRREDLAERLAEDTAADAVEIARAWGTGPIRFADDRLDGAVRAWVAGYEAPGDEPAGDETVQASPGPASTAGEEVNPLGLVHLARARIWRAKAEARRHRLAPAVVEHRCPPPGPARSVRAQCPNRGRWPARPPAGLAAGR